MSQHANPKESGSRHTPASQIITEVNTPGTATSQTALRVYLLGPFTVEQADGTLLNLDTLFGRRQSSILFKLLLCHTERRVIRERLIDVIWPGQSYNTMEGSLGVAKSILKTRLEAACGQPVMPRVSGDPPSYSLVGQTVIWTDVDTSEQFIRQAVNTKSARDALPLWEAAYALTQRGMLLDDDQFAYWYQADLVQDRRKRLARQRVQCVLRIADLSLELEDPSRAVTVLISESEAHPANEEIAFRLMELLAQKGRRAESLQRYAQLETALLERNAEPAEETQALAHRLRSNGILSSISTSIGASDLQERQLPSHVIGLRSQVPQPTGMSERRGSLSSSIDWGEAPRSKQFYGREQELSILRSWIVGDHCRMVAILGVGGIGKTSLAVAFVDQVRDGFTALFWRSLQNAPPLRDVLRDCITFLSGQRQIDLPDDTDLQIAMLLEYLCMYRCLLVLDNVETVMQDGAESGTYREGYEHYKGLFQRIGEAEHQSCLLLTSREKLKEMARLGGIDAPVRSLFLSGVGLSEGRALLKEKGLSGPDAAWEKLIQLYVGNPLALKLISELIREVFNANIAAFLQEGHTVVGDIYDLLNHQFQRLSEREKDIMYWLAIERESVPLQTLWEDTLSFVSKKEVLDVLASLRQRSMIETNDTAQFTLQPAIMEYVIDEFIRQVYEEIRAGTIRLLASHAFLKAQAKEYLREAQVRIILTSLAERLLVSPGREESERWFKVLLERLHETFLQKPSYAAGNLLNLLIHMRYDLSGYDFSGLSIRQAFLAGKTLSGINVARADLVTSVFTDTFGSILSVAFSPDGAWLAAGTTKNDIRLWQAHSGTPDLTLQGHAAWVRSVAFSPDGTMLASGGDDQTIRLWRVSGGNCLNTLHGHSAWVRSVAFSPDGGLLASGGEDQTIRLWEVTSGQSLNVLQQGHGGRVRTVAFHPDGSLLASGGEDQAIRLWEVQSGRCLNILHGHTERIRDVAFSLDGRTIASGSDDGTLRLWDTSSGACLKTLQGHTDCVRSVAFSPEMSILASGSEDRTVRLWDMKNGDCLNVLQGHTNWVWSVAFHPDGNILASGSEDQTIRMWQAEGGRCFKTLQGYVNWAWSVAFSPAGEIFVSGSEDQMVRLWDTSSGNCLNTLEGHSSRVRSVAFRPDGSLLASSSEDRTIRLWEVDSGRCLKTLQDYTYRIWSIAFSPDGTMLAGGGEDYAVCVWETSSGLILQTLQGHTDRIRAVAFSSGNIIASGSEDQTVRLWDVATNSCLHILHGHIGRVWSVAFSSNGEVLASGGDDCTVRLWRVGDGQHLNTLYGHTARVRSLAFRPNNSILASGSEDYTIRVWESGTGSCLCTLQGHTDRIRSIAFHPHKPLLISSSDDGTIKYWDMDTYSCMNTLRTHQPYEGMDITGVTGLTEVQKTTLKVLGAIEESMR